MEEQKLTIRQLCYQKYGGNKRVTITKHLQTFFNSRNITTNQGYRDRTSDRKLGFALF